ncbi:MAG: hypothetical protein D6733_00380 [Methanobacteriota archaeon]|nr:MAG: hypothetical protein D6733_00380 [Euryarchaeota archaeon]
MAAETKAVQKALKILKKELSTEEYIEFLRAITPRFRFDSTKLLRDLTKDLPMDKVLGDVQKREQA